MVTNQWKASHGVTFAEEPPDKGLKIAKYGPSLITGFYCGTGCLIANDDDMMPGQRVGQYYLTQTEGNTPPAVRITFSTPVASFSGNILDIDGNEKWVITAFNAARVQVGPSVILQSLSNSGVQTYFKFDHRKVVDISSVVFQGSDTGSLGFGFDNFSTSGICPASQFGSR